MKEPDGKSITRKELRGNLPGQTRGFGDGEPHPLKKTPGCEPGAYADACREISNPGLDGMEGVYKKMRQSERHK